MPTLTQCFSALIASGKGSRCNDFRDKIREEFLVLDEVTGEPKSLLFKYGFDKHPERHKVLRQEMGRIISSIADDVDPEVFGPDLVSTNVQRS